MENFIIGFIFAVVLLFLYIIGKVFRYISWFFCNMLLINTFNINFPKEIFYKWAIILAVINFILLLLKIRNSKLYKDIGQKKSELSLLAPILIINSIVLFSCIYKFNYLKSVTIFLYVNILIVLLVFWLSFIYNKSNIKDIQLKKAHEERLTKLKDLEYNDFYNIRKEIQHPFDLEEIFNIIEYEENREFLECNLDTVSIKNKQKYLYLIDIINIYEYYKDKINKMCNNNFKSILLIEKECAPREKHYDVFYKPSRIYRSETFIIGYNYVKNLEDLSIEQFCCDIYGIELDFYYLIDHYISLIKNNIYKIYDDLIITRRGIEGESEVLNTLKKYNDGSYQILENIRLKSYNTNIANSSEADVIIISKKGIFVLEIKNYGDDGNYTLAINKDGRWVKQYDNGNIVPIEKSPELQNIEHANTIKRTLKEELGREFLVYGMVIISNNNVNIINNRDYPVLRKEFIIPEIEKYDDILNEKDVNDIVTTLSANNLGEGTFSAVNYRKELIDVIQQFYWELNDFFAQKEGLIKNIFDFYINKVKELNNAEYELHIFKEKRDNYTLNIFEMKMKEIFKTNNCINRIETEKSINRYNTLNKSNNIEDDYIK